jgi:hypothetical protein
MRSSLDGVENLVETSALHFVLFPSTNAITAVTAITTIYYESPMKTSTSLLYLPPVVLVMT